MKTNKKREKSPQKTRKSRKIYKKSDFNSGDGMLTSVWGPGLWHYLHTMSFNYPVNPSKKDKIEYMKFVKSLVHVLPCKYCRINLKNNFKDLPLTKSHMKDRDSFSRYIYNLHEHVNRMLNKKSNLSFNDVRERYEHFRARCTNDKDEIKDKKKEKGCVTPLYGKKSRCLIKIVPQEQKCETFQIDKECIKKIL
tara:strand:+ start:1312 stop:1893 length:582 start_codon:yes stop_codon:yes gene_type:complete